MNPLLIRIGAFCGLALAGSQLIGLILHGSIPMSPGDGLTFVHQHVAWVPTHVLIIASYFLVIAFYVALAATYKGEHFTVTLGEPLVLVGAVAGVVHFTLHLGAYPSLAERYSGKPSADTQARLELIFETLHHYAGVLRMIQALALMAAALLFALAMLREADFPEWLATMGLAAAGVTALAVLVGALFLSPSAADIVFAIGLLPTLAWVALTSRRMLQLFPRAARPA
jgi:hypothetical protein